MGAKVVPSIPKPTPGGARPREFIDLEIRRRNNERGASNAIVRRNFQRRRPTTVMRHFTEIYLSVCLRLAGQGLHPAGDLLWPIWLRNQGTVADLADLLRPRGVP